MRASRMGLGPWALLEPLEQSEWKYPRITKRRCWDGVDIGREGEMKEQGNKKENIRVHIRAGQGRAGQRRLGCTLLGTRSGPGLVYLALSTIFLFWLIILSFLYILPKGSVGVQEPLSSWPFSPLLPLLLLSPPPRRLPSSPLTLLSAALSICLSLILFYSSRPASFSIFYSFLFRVWPNWFASLPCVAHGPTGAVGPDAPRRCLGDHPQITSRKKSSGETKASCESDKRVS